MAAGDDLAMDNSDALARPAWYVRLAPLLPALVVMAVFAPVLGGGTEFYFEDHVRFSSPIAAMFAEAIRAGHLPLWNPWILTGTPLVAERGSMVAHPGMWLALLMTPSHAVGTLMVLLLAALAAGSTGLLRALGVRPILAVAIGAAIGLCGPALSCTTLGPYLGTLACWPFVLWSAVRLARGHGSPWEGGLALGLALLGGDLPGALLSALVAVAVLIAVGGGRSQVRSVVAVAVIALLVGAGAWYPVVWALPFSERAAGIAASEAGRWSMHPGELVGLFWPHPLGLPLPQFTLWPFRWVGERLLVHSLYIGAIVAAAALMALRRGERVARVLTVAALVLLLAATGSSTPLWWLLRPLFTFLRYPSKLVAPAALLLALAGALMVDRMLARPRALRLLCSVVALVAAAGALVGPILQGVLARRAGAPEQIIVAAATALRSDCWRVATLAVVGAAVAWLLIRDRLPASWAAAMLSTLLFLDVFTTTADVAWTRAVVTRACPSYLPDVGARGARVMRLAEVGTQRLALNEQGYTEEQLRMAALLAPMTNATCHAAVLDPYGLFMGEVGTAMASLAASNPAALAEVTASDRVLATPGARAPWLTKAIDSGRLAPFATSPAGALVLRPSQPLPRSFVSTHATLDSRHAIPDHLAAGTAQLLIARDRVLRAGHFVMTDESPLPASLLDAGPVARVPLAPSLWRPGYARYRVSGAVPVLLVEMDAFAPGWRAYVDGHEETILQADAFGRAVAVPAGEHTVEWRFFPPAVVASLITTWMALGLTLILLAIGRARRKATLP
jgi:hypothetical protein